MYSSDFVSSMKLLLVIFVAVVSIPSGHSSISSTNDQESASTTRDQIKFPCPHGYRLNLDECVEIIMVGPVCPVKRGNSDGDRCVISSKHCPSGYYLLEDHQTCVKDEVKAKVKEEVKENIITDKEEKRVPGKFGCDLNYSFDKEKGVCSKDVDIGAPYYSEDDSIHCKYGYVKKGRCVATTTMKSKWTCSKKPEKVNRSVGKFKLGTKPVVICLEGIIRRGVCNVVRSVQPVIGCPEGYSADSAGKECNLVDTTTTLTL